MRRSLLLLALLWASPAEAARIVTSGFEFNSVTAIVECEAVSGSPVVDTTADRSGVYGLHLSSLTSATPRLCRFPYIAVGTATNVVYARFYVRFVTLPGANDSTIACITGSASNTCLTKVKVLDTGVVQLIDEDANVFATDFTLSTGTWYCIELFVDGSQAGGSDVATMKLGTVACGGDIETETQPAGTFDTAYGSLMLGGNLQSEATTTGEWYIDDVAVNDTTGSAQTGYPGAGAVVLLPTDGDGLTTNRGVQGTDWETCTNNDASCGAGTGGTAFEFVDDANTPDDVTTHLRVITQSTGCTDPPVLLFNTASLTSRGTSGGVAVDSNDTITLVNVRIRHGSDAAGSRIYVPLMYSGTFCRDDGTVISVGSTAYQWDATQQPRHSKLVAYVNPDGDAAWTLAAVDAVQVGLRGHNDVAPQIQITMVAAEVEYVAVANSATGGGRSLLLWAD